MKNKTANEYNKEYLKLKKDIVDIQNEAREKLIDMCNKYPDASIGIYGNVVIKAGGIGNKTYIYMLEFQAVINYMIEIEKHIESTLPQQLEIPFN